MNLTKTLDNNIKKLEYIMDPKSYVIEDVDAKSRKLICRKCGLEIIGSTDRQVLWNFRIHYESKHG